MCLFMVSILQIRRFNWQWSLLLYQLFRPFQEEQTNIGPTVQQPGDYSYAIQLTKLEISLEMK